MSKRDSWFHDCGVHGIFYSRARSAYHLFNAALQTNDPDLWRQVEDMLTPYGVTLSSRDDRARIVRVEANSNDGFELYGEAL